MDIIFNIKSYVGAKPLLFDMSPVEVKKNFGFVPQVSKNYSGERNENYEGVGVRYSKDDNKIVEIAFLPDKHTLVFNDIQLFGPEAISDPLNHLLQSDSKPREVYGFIVFLDLGITVTGYHDNDKAQRAITVFRKNRWDKLLEDSKIWKQ